jgi:hypothetical protein
MKKRMKQQRGGYHERVTNKNTKIMQRRLKMWAEEDETRKKV